MFCLVVLFFLSSAAKCDKELNRICLEKTNVSLGSLESQIKVKSLLKTKPIQTDPIIKKPIQEYRSHLIEIGFHQSNLCFHFAFFIGIKIGIENLTLTKRKHELESTTRIFIASIPFLSWTGSFYCFCLYFKKSEKL